MTTTNVRPHEILLVEDNPADVRLALEAIKRLGEFHNVSVVGDGIETLAFLRQEPPKYEGAPRPDLILLDLNMRRKDGRETLAEIKANRHLRSIPVIVFTTSDHERDVFNAYDHYANAYVVKPRSLYDYMNVMKSTTQFWFGTAKHLLR